MARQGYLKIDPESQGVITISTIHANIHQGKAYTFSINDIVVSGLSTYYILFKTGSSEVHIFNSNIVVTSAPFIFHIHEDAIVSDNGTLKTTYNVNRESANTPTSQIYTSPTVTETGTDILLNPIAGGKTIGTGVTGSFGERNLKPNSNYLFEFENVNNIDSDLGILIDWYESE